MPQCKHVKSDGNRCRANAQHSAEFCFFHDPDKESQREEASRSGGQAGPAKVLPDAPRVAVASSSDVSVLLGETINQVRRGQLDPRRANAVGYLANVLLKALEQGRIEDTLFAVLAALTKQQRTRSGDDPTDVSHLAVG